MKENTLETLQLLISLTMTVSDFMSMNNISNSYLLVTGLEINFEESDYSIVEGGTLSTIIRLQFRNNQNSFTVRLCPLSITDTEIMGLGSFIESETIGEISRATPGKLLIYYNNDIVLPLILMKPFHLSHNSK